MRTPVRDVQRLVVKIGSNVLTTDQHKPNRVVMRQLVRDVITLRERGVVLLLLLRVAGCAAGVAPDFDLFQLVLHDGVARVELEALFVGLLRRRPVLQADVRGAAARVALGPILVQLDALVGVEKRLLELRLGGVGSRAVGEENVVGRVCLLAQKRREIRDRRVRSQTDKSSATAH